MQKLITWAAWIGVTASAFAAALTFLLVGIGVGETGPMTTRFGVAAMGAITLTLVGAVGIATHAVLRTQQEQSTDRAKELEAAEEAGFWRGCATTLRDTAQAQQVAEVTPLELRRNGSR